MQELRNTNSTPEIMQKPKASNQYEPDYLWKSARSEAADKILLSARKTLEQTQITLIKSDELD